MSCFCLPIGNVDISSQNHLKTSKKRINTFIYQLTKSWPLIQRLMETSGKRVHTKNVFDQTRLLIPEMPTWRKTKQAGPRFQRIQRGTLIGNAGWDRAGIRCNCTYQEDCECFWGFWYWGLLKCVCLYHFLWNPIWTDFFWSKDMLMMMGGDE